MGKCTYCDREFIGRGLGGHVIRCNRNPNRTRKNGHEGKTISDSRRAKLKESMRRHFDKNPHMIPFRLYHSSKRSNPELLFEKRLIESGIDFVSEFNHGIYTYDFALVKEKIDIEIDGSTHTQPHVQEIDRRRDQWSKDNGWRVFRIPAKDVKNNLEEAFQRFIEFRKLDW